MVEMAEVLKKSESFNRKDTVLEGGLVVGSQNYSDVFQPTSVCLLIFFLGGRAELIESVKIFTALPEGICCERRWRRY